ncbi:MAG: CoA pyrophosphatase [Peptococcaceae bacterium]|nr:CoA pyrophosphatase [Peptococcaceae bacterium]
MSAIFVVSYWRIYVTERNLALHDNHPGAENDPATIKKLLQHRTPEILGNDEYHISAVLIPLVMRQNELHILFEVRARTLRGQPGEICFPGGRIDSQDTSPAAAAVRETVEELGIAKEQIEILGPLDVLVTPHQRIMHPFAGWLKEDALLQPAPEEVAEVFYVPFSFLLNAQPLLSWDRVELKPEKDFHFELIPGGESYSFRQGHYPVYFYLYGQYTIWGLTARILRHLLDLIR